MIADPAVAEHHAEIIVTDDGRFFITDCGTASGTWRLVAKGEDSGWRPIRQAFIERDEPLRLGEYECRVSDMLTPLTPEGAADRRSGKGIIRAGGGRVRRDPVTGEIVRGRV